MDWYTERWLVAHSMEKFGGSFLISLSDAIFKADKINGHKIKKAFPEEWKKYLALGQKNVGKDKGG